jgi:hypothetical protein
MSTHARKAESPMATKPTAEAATCTVDASPLRLLLVVEFESELEPTVVASAANVVEDEVGYGPGTQQGLNLCGCGCGDQGSTWALTAFGLHFEGVTVGVILRRGQNGNTEQSADTYASAVENVGEVDDIACTGDEVGDEINSALVIILC